VLKVLQLRLFRVPPPFSLHSVFATTLISNLISLSGYLFLLMVKTIVIRYPRYASFLYFRFLIDSNDGQATTLCETGTEETRALGFLTRHLGSVHS
jgi:hypothetical protein